jgi:putative transcriptional regulator
MTIIAARIRDSDGALVRVHPDGREEVLGRPAVAAMSDEEVMAAALADPDAQPLSEADLARMRRTPRIRVVRRALGLSQEAFCARFHVPLAMLRDWERGLAEPDAAMRAYLEVIAAAPEVVARALAPMSETP